MTIPYTYLITHIPTNKKYYGVRYAKGCHPKDLGIKYFSSSKDLLLMIEQEGLESFKFEIRKTFKSKQQACEWEAKVLKRLKVHLNENWINKAHNYTFAMYNPEVVKKVRDTNMSKLNFFKELGKKGAASRIAKGKHLIRYAAKTYKVTFLNGDEEIVTDLKKFANKHNARYDTLRGCVSGNKSYKSKGIAKVEIWS
jgi:hypothetical protein